MYYRGQERYYYTTICILVIYNMVVIWFDKRTQERKFSVQICKQIDHYSMQMLLKIDYVSLILYIYVLKRFHLN